MRKAMTWTTTALIFLALAAPGFAAATQEKPLTPAQQMDKLFDFWNRQDQPGFAVVVVKDGQVLYRNVFGLACQEHAAAITPNTVFNTATLGQAFVGQAVAILAEQGKLSLDDDVRKLIPELPDFGTPVKLRHLVFHSSGLRDWLPVLRLAGRDREEVTLDKVLKIVEAQKQPLFTPGERTEYSNTNYDLLAETVKRATGKPFSDWAWENIFRPQKMTRTQFRDNCRSIFDDEALSYNYTRNEYLRGIDNLSLAGSHSLFTSIADLAKWLAILETPPAAGRGLYAGMFAPGALDDGKPSKYGYGLEIGTRAGRRAVWQSGAWAGSGAHLVYFPDEKLGFAVLANWDYTPVEGFAGDIIDIFLPAPAPAPAAKKPAPAAAGKKVKISPAVLDRYAGQYRFAGNQIFTFVREGDQLVLSVPGQKFPLTTLSETEFFLDIASGRIVFRKDKAGRIQEFVWSRGGEEIVAPKVELVTPTPEQLREFAGTYSNAEVSLRLGLEARGEALFLLPPGRAEVRLAPDEKDRFTSGAGAFSKLVFQRDSQARITGFFIDGDSVRDLVFTKQ